MLMTLIYLLEDFLKKETRMQFLDLFLDALLVINFTSWNLEIGMYKKLDFIDQIKFDQIFGI